MMKLHDIRRSQYVIRWHLVNMRREQNIASHSWEVALLSLAIAEQCEPQIKGARLAILLRGALLHDVGEVYTGDIAGASKEPGNRYKESVALVHLLGGKGLGLDGELADIVKLADLLEAAKWISENGADTRHVRIVSESAERRAMEFELKGCLNTPGVHHLRSHYLSDVPSLMLLFGDERDFIPRKVGAAET